MKRREFIALLGGAATWPVAARAQQRTMPVVGYLNSESPDLFPERTRAFRQGLAELGFTPERNVTIEYRWAEGKYDQLPKLASELVRRQVTVIAANGPSVLPAKGATNIIPIVFFTGADPVGSGLVVSLNRPGGNLTGVTTLATELGLKRLQLLHELVPTATVIALLVNPSNPTSAILSRDMLLVTRQMGLQLHILKATSQLDFDPIFVTLSQLRVGGLLIGADAFFNTQIDQLAVLTLRHAIPTIFQYREFAAAGGLVSYGTSITNSYREFGVYTGRILKGDRPAELPVLQAVKVEMILNMKTAKALGLTVSLPLLGRADEVIE